MRTWKKPSARAPWSRTEIAVDTNIIVRLLARDRETQFSKAFQVIKDSPRVFLSDTVILETVWVLRHAHGFSSRDIHDALQALFGLNNIVLRDAVGLSKVLAWYKSGLDFVDAMHLAQCTHCREMLTFDKGFAQRRGLSVACPVRLL